MVKWLKRRENWTLGTELETRAVVLNLYLVVFVYTAFLIWPPAGRPVLNAFIFFGFAYVIFGNALLYKKAYVRKGSFFLFAGLFLIMLDSLKSLG